MAGAMKILGRTEKISSIKKPTDIEHLKKIVHEEKTDEENLQVKEQCILDLGRHLSETGKAIELANLIKTTRPFLNLISKAKAAKLIRALVDMFLDMEAGTGMEVELCIECIEWAKQEKRTFLRQSLEARLIALYYDTHKYSDALQLGSTLLKELKKLDDKNLLVEVQLLESKVYHALSNLPRARAALTSARTTANGIYCPPKLQAALDLQSGILHAADEKDFKTAFSYFYEAFEGYDSVDSPKAVVALKYMLLSKIMLNLPDEVNSIIMGKLVLKYAGPEIDAMKAIAQASRNRSMAELQTALTKYKAQLVDDPIIKSHLNTLYDTMMEKNLCRIIEPFSRIQIEHVAKIINLPLEPVEKKLSQMILDKKLNGILDQGEGVLIIFEDTDVNKTYEAALETIQSLGKVVDALYQKVTKIS